MAVGKSYFQRISNSTRRHFVQSYNTMAYMYLTWCNKHGVESPLVNIVDCAYAAIAELACSKWNPIKTIINGLIRRTISSRYCPRWKFLKIFHEETRRRGSLKVGNILRRKWRTRVKKLKAISVTMGTSEEFYVAGNQLTPAGDRTVTQSSRKLPTAKKRNSNSRRERQITPPGEWNSI